MALRDAPIGRVITNGLLLIAAMVLLFEEWLWQRSTSIATRLGRLPVFSRAESWIRGRSRWQAATLFVLPIAVIFPLKALALIVMAYGYVLPGVAIFVLAKIVATAVFARLYQLTEPAITQLAWVMAARNAFLRGRAFVHAWLDAQPAYRRMRRVIRTQSARLAFYYRAAYRLQRRRGHWPPTRRVSRDRHGDRLQRRGHARSASKRQGARDRSGR